jgi:hypothetical protein
MGRTDQLIVVVAGTVLAGFVGLVFYAALGTVGIVDRSPASAEGASSGYGSYGAAVVDTGAESEDELPEDGATGPAVYEVEPGILDGETVEYLEAGTNTPMTEDRNVPTAPIWVFISGFDADGRPQMIPDHPTVLDVVPGDAGYSDLWDVHFVYVPEGYDSSSIHSLADLNASGLDEIPAGMLVNCPVIPEGATSELGHEPLPGWYEGELVHYFDFGMTTTEPGDVYEFVTREGTHVDTPPLFVLSETDGDAPVAQFFRVHEVTVADAAEASSITSLADIEARGLPVEATGDLANAPLVFAES